MNQILDIILDIILEMEISAYLRIETIAYRVPYETILPFQGSTSP